MITSAKCRVYARQSQLLGKTLDVSIERRKQAATMALKWNCLADRIDCDEAKLTNLDPRGRPGLVSEATMPAVKLRASTILGAFDEVQSELVGKAVILTDGKSGTVENVWLDELHGVRISVAGHDGKWPVSTIKFARSG
jgi:hypothetical protein